jgi:hypothetical protein
MQQRRLAMRCAWFVGRQDIVYFVDICALYACRHAPYAAKLGICDNLSPKRTVICRPF